MEFFKTYPKLVALGLAVLLAVAGYLLKIDVPALLSSVGAIDKQIEGLAPAAPAAPAR